MTTRVCTWVCTGLAHLTWVPVAVPAHAWLCIKYVCECPVMMCLCARAHVSYLQQLAMANRGCPGQLHALLSV